MGSKANLRGLANAMAVAALVGGPAAGGGELNLEGIGNALYGHMIQEVAQAAVDAAQGENVAKDGVNRLVNVFVNAGAGLAANHIGNLYDEGKIGYAWQKGMHALLGAAQAFVLEPHNLGGALVAGAGAAVVEMAAGALQAANLMDRNVAADVAKVLVVAAAVAAGQDHVMVERVARNAVENNNKNHPDDKEKEDVEGEERKNLSFGA